MDNETTGYNGTRPQAGRALMGETQGDTGQVGGDPARRKAGLYRHPNGTEVITQHDLLFGDTQSRAAERAGFEYVREVEPGEIKTVGAPSDSHAAQPERALEAQTSELADLRARLAALEAADATRKNAAVAGTEVPGTEPVKGAEATKQAAADKTSEQTGVQVDPATGDVAAPPAPAVSDKPLDNQNREELNATALAEGLTEVEEYESKAKLVEAIEAKRAELPTDGGNE